MTINSTSTLKSQNFVWHVALVTADAIVLAIFIAPELIASATVTQMGLFRALGAAILPVLVLLLLNVMSSAVKAMLVYWRPYGWLPGCEAFTKYGPADQRIDMAQLKKNAGGWSEDPKEQNAKWFKLYKLVEAQPEVASAQKDFLMYRDMAAFTLPLIVIATLALYFSDAQVNAIWGAFLLLVVQYLLTAISAANAGKRFVTNVLALHSAKRITSSKTTPI